MLLQPSESNFFTSSFTNELQYHFNCHTVSRGLSKKEVNTNLLATKKAQNKYKKDVDLPIITVLWNMKHLRQSLMICLDSVFNFCGFWYISKSKKATIRVKLTSKNFRSWGFELTDLLSTMVQAAVFTIQKLSPEIKDSLFCLPRFFGYYPKLPFLLAHIHFCIRGRKTLKGPKYITYVPNYPCELERSSWNQACRIEKAYTFGRQTRNE